MEHLLIIHVGPVQDFIARARRSRDLWYGSWVLSELAKAAAIGVRDQADGNRLIFPATETDLKADTVSVPNRIVSIVETPKDAAEAAREELVERLEGLRKEAFAFIRGSLRNEEAATAQVRDLPEFYWAATPLDIPYPQARKRAEALLAARKNTRDYAQVGWGANAPKSSLDGERESVIPKDAFTKGADYLYHQYGARRAEQLSGVDLLKRLGNRGEESRFPSTSHVATLPLLGRLSKQDGIEEQWKTYLDALPNKVKEREIVPPRYSHKPFSRIEGSVDGSVLFASRLAEELEEEELGDAQEALQTFLNKAAGGEEPNPYYALLLGDGDDMGRIIDAQRTEDAHRELSATLAAFAQETQEIVGSYEGALVYAGGDDVLAFLPLHTVLDCASKLAERFRTVMADTGYKDVDGRTATFSAGIAISHHLEPMSDALELARDTERLAKTVDGKDALAIAVDKRSGVPRTVRGHWHDLYPRLQRLIYYQRQEIDAFPGGAAYELRDVVLELGGDDRIRGEQPLQDVLREEGKRILTRKRMEHGARKLSTDVRKEVAELWQSTLAIAAEDTTQTFLQATDELVIARLFARAADHAGLPLEKEKEETT